MNVVNINANKKRRVSITYKTMLIIMPIADGPLDCVSSLFIVLIALSLSSDLRLQTYIALAMIIESTSVISEIKWVQRGRSK